MRSYVDNGRDLSVGEIRAVRDAASAKGVPVTVVEPGHEQIPPSRRGGRESRGDRAYLMAANVHHGPQRVLDPASDRLLLVVDPLYG